MGVRTLELVPNPSSPTLKAQRFLKHSSKKDLTVRSSHQYFTARLSLISTKTGCSFSRELRSVIAFTLKAKSATNRPSIDEGYVATSPAGRITKLPGRHLPRLLIHLYLLESTPIRKSVPILVFT